MHDFESREAGLTNAYVWEISNITQWKSAEIDVFDRVNELEKADEIVFTFRLHQSDTASTATHLAEKMAKLILELPEKFSYKKVSI